MAGLRADHFVSIGCVCVNRTPNAHSISVRTSSCPASIQSLSRPSISDTVESKKAAAAGHRPGIGCALGLRPGDGGRLDAARFGNETCNLLADALMMIGERHEFERQLAIRRC
jgi:hypothetical protein